jgi:hypothetical protein
MRLVPAVHPTIPGGCITNANGTGRRPILVHTVQQRQLRWRRARTKLLEFARSDVHPVGGPLEDFADAFNYAILRFSYTSLYLRVFYPGPLPAFRSIAHECLPDLSSNSQCSTAIRFDSLARHLHDMDGHQGPVQG